MAFLLKITLQGSSKPPIWRKIKLSEDTTFEDLHYIIQESFGWENSHLAEFTPKGFGSYPVISVSSIGFFFDNHDDDTSDPKTFPMGDKYDAEDIKLKDYFKKPKQKMVYIYDFGDNWTHIIELVEITDEKQDYPVCVSGKGSNLTEDCGGIWGFYNMVEAVNDPNHPDHEDVMDWLDMEEGEKWDLNKFDIEELNEVLMGF